MVARLRLLVLLLILLLLLPLPVAFPVRGLLPVPPPPSPSVYSPLVLSSTLVCTKAARGPGTAARAHASTYRSRSCPRVSSSSTSSSFTSTFTSTPAEESWLVPKVIFRAAVARVCARAVQAAQTAITLADEDRTVPGGKIEATRVARCAVWCAR